MAGELSRERQYGRQSDRARQAGREERATAEKTKKMVPQRGRERAYP